MTIKEIETLSEMTRANIRFYEAEGLLSPVRSQNGYRDYSEEDLETLKRIRLLRTLRVSLEDIKALREGTEDLISVLDRHMALLAAEQVSIGQSQDVCREIRNAGVNFQTLNAQRYLDALNHFPEVTAEVPESDSIPPIWAPVRRLFARMLDWTLSSTLWDCILMCVFNANLLRMDAAFQIFYFIVKIATMLCLESGMLVLFGTTIGKWILGLYVTDNDGGRLSWEKAFKRTRTVLWKGLGFHIGGYRLYRLWKSYQASANQETLDWEYDSNLMLKDEKNWRWAALAAAFGMSVLMLCMSVAHVQSPINDGDITVAEFSENFNRLSEYYGLFYGEDLDEDGNWREYPNYAGDVTIYVGGKVDTPDFFFTEENGFVTEVSFRMEITEDVFLAPSCRNQMMLTALSFAGGQDGYGAFGGCRKRMLETIENHEYEGFTFSENGITIACEVEYSGYIGGSGSGVLWAEEGADTYYSLAFSIKKVNQ